MIQTYFCPIKTLIHLLIVWMWNLPISQRGLSQTNCLWILIKPNGCYFIFSQHYFQTFPNLLIGNIHIKREHVTKFLGIFNDQNLSWKQNIDILGSKISKSIGIRYKYIKSCIKETMFKAAIFFVHS